MEEEQKGLGIRSQIKDESYKFYYTNLTLEYLYEVAINLSRKEEDEPIKMREIL